MLRNYRGLCQSRASFPADPAVQTAHPGTGIEYQAPRERDRARDATRSSLEYRPEAKHCGAIQIQAAAAPSPKMFPRLDGSNVILSRNAKF